MEVVGSCLEVARAWIAELLDHQRPLDLDTLMTWAGHLEDRSLHHLTGCKEVCERVYDVGLWIDVCDRSVVSLVDGALSLLASSREPCWLVQSMVEHTVW